MSETFGEFCRAAGVPEEHGVNVRFNKMCRELGLSPDDAFQKLTLARAKPATREYIRTQAFPDCGVELPRRNFK